MSGIFGQVCRSDDFAAARSAAILARLPRRPLNEMASFQNQAGNVFLSSLQPKWKHSRECASQRSESFIVVDGFAQMRPHVQSPWRACGAAEILDLVERSGLGALGNLKGRFNAAIWQAAEQRLLLFNDPVGHKLVFFARAKDRLIFGSDLQFIVDIREREPTLSLTGVSELVNYGFILGQDTLFEGIRVLAPGSVLVFEAGTLRETRYWHTNEVAVRRRYDSDLIDELSQALVAALAQPISRNNGDIAISLTGGLDSRCLYAAALQTAPEILAHTAGRPDSTDVGIASEIVALTGGRRVLERIEPDELSKLLVPMVYLQGGLMGTLHCHPCQLLAHELPVNNLVQGVGGEFCRGADWIAPGDLKKRINDEFVESKLLMPNTRKLDQRALWVEGTNEEQKSIRLGRLTDILRQYDNNDHPLSALKTISLYDMSRKFLNKSGMIASINREIHYPYFDFDWVRLVAALPIEQRLENNLQLDILRRLDERLAKVVYAKTMLPLTASPWRVKASKHYRGFLQRAARVLGGTPQFAIPNHDYRHWIRHQMSAAIRAIVLRRHAHYERYLKREFVEQIFSDHMQGKRNWESLIAAIFVLELACMLWIEKRPEAVDGLSWFEAAARATARK